MAIPVSNINSTLATPVINRLDPGSVGYIPPAELQSTLDSINPVSGSAVARAQVDALDVINEVRPFISALSTSTNNLVGELNGQLNNLRVLDGLQPGENGLDNEGLASNALGSNALGSEGLAQNLAQPNAEPPAFAAVTPPLQQQTTGPTSQPVTGEQLTNAPVTSFDPADTNLDGNISPQEDFAFTQQSPVTSNAPATQAADTNADGTVSAQENINFLQQNDDGNSAAVLDNGSLSSQDVVNQQAAERQAALLTSTYGPNTNLGGEQTSSGGILSLAA